MCFQAYLSVRVLDSGYIGLTKRSFHETQHERALADTARPKHNHAIIVALLRHPDICRPDDVNPRQPGSKTTVNNKGAGRLTLLKVQGVFSATERRETRQRARSKEPSKSRSDNWSGEGCDSSSIAVLATRLACPLSEYLNYGC
ncbi:hypothetical protein K0M31_015216 [Melipona bicolor]|uniref:Uncharacterized protein n=1 Tax=Melipona bicolor TaxID=60889 RepID=A0AA40FFX9_9HYME|nr:hypothetical protein K0M31_015216 [Melipona bicolor]